MSKPETRVPAPAVGHGAVLQDEPRGRLEDGVRQLVARFADTHTDWDGVAVIPGDPTHWVHLSAGEIVSFQSFLTLRLAKAFGAEDATPDNARLEDTMARPERLAMYLSVAELGRNRDEILGALMGAELAAAKAYWLGQQVVLLGDGALVEGYHTALAAQGVPVARG